MNQFGRLFRVSVLGESHGHMVGVVLDGVPAGLKLQSEDFQTDLNRRRAGAKGTTSRKEADLPQLATGVFEGMTTGTPLTILFENTNVRSKDYSNLINSPRPGHADFVAKKKFGGFNDYRGGGHFSGRLTLCLVSAGVIAKKLLRDIKISAELIEAGGSQDVMTTIDNAIATNDSIGGIIHCTAQGIPVGLGEPFFDSLESVIAHLVFAIPATKGVEFGSGFASANMFGSQHNDNILNASGTTETNNAGGINGGISNGNDLVFRVAIKPTSSISKVQRTMNMSKAEVEDLQIVGRHDVCIALRAAVVVEAIAAMALTDLSMQAGLISRIIK